MKLIAGVESGSSDWKPPANIQVIDEVHEVQQLSPSSFVSRTTRRSSETIVPEGFPVTLTPVPEQVRVAANDEK